MKTSIARLASILLPLVTLAGSCAHQDPTAHSVDSTAVDNPVLQVGSSPVLSPGSKFTGSPVPEVGLRGLFPVRSPQECEVAVLQGGEDSFAVRMAELRRARTSVRIQALVFKGDESGLQIAEVLKQKRAEGLDVRVIVDGFSNPGLQTQWMYFDLKQHGIEVEGYEAVALQWLNEVPIPLLTPYSDFGQLDKRFHEKMWIIDGETEHRVAVVGGLNIGNEYFRANPGHPDATWRDQDVVVRGAVVEDMVAAFDRNFDYFTSVKESRGVFNTNLYWDATRNVLDETGRLPIQYISDPSVTAYVVDLETRQPRLDFRPSTCRFLQSRPRLEETYIQQAYIKLFSQAQDEILVANAYFVPTESMAATIKAAARRCVSIKLITNSPETNDLPEISLVGRGYYGDLMSVNHTNEVRECGKSDAGVRIWQWTGKAEDEEAPSQGTMHSKFAVVDQQISIVGSYNLDPRSEKLNSESVLVFHEQGLAEQLRHLFFENDLNYSREVSAEEAAAFEEPDAVIERFRKSIGGLFEEEL